jgi:hypothetical protein
VAVVVRGVVSQRAGSLYPDGAVELELAQALLDRRWEQALELRFPPLFACLTAALAWLSGAALETCGLVVTVLGSAWVAPACAGAAAALATRSRAQVAFAAGLLAALQPWPTRLGGQVMAYGLAHAALAGALWLTIRAAGSRRPRDAAAAGLLVGLGYLGRADALASGAGLALALALGRGRGRRARQVAVFGLACGLAMSPYVLAIRQHTGTWRLSLKKQVSDLTSASIDRAPPREGTPEADVHLLIRSEERPGDPSALVYGPGSFPLGESVVYASEKVATAANPLLVGLFALGLCLPHAARTRPVALLALLGFTAAQTLLKATHGYTHTPHCSAAGVLVVPQAALALTATTRWLATRVGGRPRIWVASGLLAALFVLLPKALKPQLQARRAEPVLGHFLRRAWGDAPLTICGRGSRVIAHYAQARYVVLTHAPAAEAVSAARAAGADLLVIQVRSLAQRPGHLEQVLEELGLRPLEHSLGGRDGARGRTYEWLVYRLAK